MSDSNKNQISFDRYKHHGSTEHLVKSLVDIFPKEIPDMIYRGVPIHSLLLCAASLFYAEIYDPYLLDSEKKKLGLDKIKHAQEDVAIAVLCLYKANCLPNGKNSSGV